MMMRPSLRKLALTAHLTFSIGWVGAVTAFLALAVAGVSSNDAHMVRAAYLAMGLLVSWGDRAAGLHVALSGLVSALGTKWGLVRHYWVLVKLRLTIVAIVILLVQVAPTSRLAEAAADPTWTATVVREMKRPLIHAGGGWSSCSWCKC